MERVELTVELREAAGKGGARRVRSAGQVPGVMYGAGKAATPIAVERLRMDRVANLGTNQLIDLKGPGDIGTKLVLLKELQRDPVSQQLVHVDFFAVDTNKKIHVQVPIHLEGRARGVELGGTLEHMIRELEVECLPLAIPENLAVDVSALEIGDAIHASEVLLPEGVNLISDETITLLHVIAPRVEETPEEAEEGEGEAAASDAAPAAEASASED